MVLHVYMFDITCAYCQQVMALHGFVEILYVCSFCVFICGCLKQVVRKPHLCVLHAVVNVPTRCVFEFQSQLNSLVLFVTFSIHSTR